MPLENLRLGWSHDLASLAGLETLTSLTHLTIHASPHVDDLSPLRGLPLREVRLTNLGVQDLSSLSASPCEPCDVTSIV